MTIPREGHVLAVLHAYPDGANRAQIARALGVATSTVMRWELRAHRSFRREARALGLDWRALLVAASGSHRTPADLTEPGVRMGIGEVVTDDSPSPLSVRIDGLLTEAEERIRNALRVLDGDAPYALECGRSDRMPL